MTQAILASGLVSPYGSSVAEHAFFLRALLPPPAGSPFIGPNGKPTPLEHCRWIGAATPVAERLVALARRALQDAMAPLEAHQPRPRVGLLLCTSRSRPGLADDDLRRATDEIVSLVDPLFVMRAYDSAGVFAALPGCIERAEHEGAFGLLAVAVDSFVSLEYLTSWVQRPPNRWMTWPPSPSECAAAVCIAPMAAARRDQRIVLGELLGSAVAKGQSTDDDDEIVDGTALTEIVRRVAGSPVHYVFGQDGVDNLRSREWLLAMARTAERFRAGHDDVSLEASIGSVGAAAGLASLVYGVGALRHRTLSARWSHRPPLLAWCISRDGTRGAASVRVEEPR